MPVGVISPHLITRKNSNNKDESVLRAPDDIATSASYLILQRLNLEIIKHPKNFDFRLKRAHVCLLMNYVDKAYSDLTFVIEKTSTLPNPIYEQLRRKAHAIAATNAELNQKFVDFVAKHNIRQSSPVQESTIPGLQ